MPKVVVKRVPAMASLIWARCSLVETPKLASDVALLTAASWEKWTM